MEMFEVILGTYEEFVLGYNVNPCKPENSSQTFALHSHASSVRSVACADNLLASGGADDRVIVYDLRARRELCMLTHHNGTVNCLQFTKDRSHLISGSQDGVLSIIRVGNWQLEKEWQKAHKGSAIIDIAVHSSGKMMLTLGSDHALRTWNLVKGRQAYAINLNSKSADAKSLQQIRWSPGGELFTLSGGRYTEIWSIKTGGLLQSIQHESKVSCCEWLDDEKLVCGLENGKIVFFNSEGSVIESQDCHTARVKVIGLHGKYLITAASDGEMKVWKASNMKELVKLNSGCRITCMCISETFKVKEEKAKDVEEILEDSIESPQKRKIPVVEIIEETEEVDTPKKKKKKKLSLSNASETTITETKTPKKTPSKQICEDTSTKKKRKRKSAVQDDWTVETK